ncbi:MAG: TonB-dependent receptor, partial [Aquificaceae bacterium]|nr:TonB-dependent receptor [Aquificaceae bacterium]
DNIAKARIGGLELSGYAKPTKWLLIRLGYTYLDAKDEERDRRLLQRPKHRAVGEVGFMPFEGTRVSLFLEHSSGILLTQTLKKNYTLLHASASQKLWKGLELYGGVENLTNKKDTDLPLLGSFYYAGLRGVF